MYVQQTFVCERPRVGALIMMTDGAMAAMITERTICEEARRERGLTGSAGSSHRAVTEALFTLWPEELRLLPSTPLSLQIGNTLSPHYAV